MTTRRLTRIRLADDLIFAYKANPSLFQDFESLDAFLEGLDGMEDGNLHQLHQQHFGADETPYEDNR